MKTVCIQSYFGLRSGVIDGIIGRENGCYAFDLDDSLGIIGCLLTQISEGNDIKVSQFEEADKV